MIFLSDEMISKANQDLTFANYRFPPFIEIIFNANDDLSLGQKTLFHANRCCSLANKTI
jgi:hypothetical protein